MHLDITQREAALVEEVLERTLDDLEAKLYAIAPVDAEALQLRDEEIKALLRHVEAQQPVPAAERASLDGLVGPFEATSRRGKPGA